MFALAKKYPIISTAVAFLILGIGPLFIADLVHRLGFDESLMKAFGFDSVGFGLMWGLSVGAGFTIVGILLLIVAGLVRLFKLSIGK
jgi:hypothetical protein